MLRKCIISLFVLSFVCIIVRHVDALTMKDVLKKDKEAISRHQQIAITQAGTQKAADALRAMGLLRDRQGKYSKAIECYKKSINNSKNKFFITQVSFYLGQAYENKKEYNSAIRVYQDLLNKASTDEQVIKAKKRIAFAYLNQRKHQKGMEILEKIIKEYPKSKHSADVRFSIATAYHHKIKNYPKAVKEYQRMIKNHLDDWRVRLCYAKIGEVYTVAKKYEKAIAAYEEIVKKYHGTDNAKAARAYIKLIEEYYKKGKTPSSVKEIEQIFRKEGLTKRTSSIRTDK